MPRMGGTVRKVDTSKHTEGSAEYSGVHSVPVPETSGYPVKGAKKQSVKTRGTGAATQGTKSSTKLG